MKATHSTSGTSDHLGRPAASTRSDGSTEESRSPSDSRCSCVSVTRLARLARGLLRLLLLRLGLLRPRCSVRTCWRPPPRAATAPATALRPPRAPQAAAPAAGPLPSPPRRRPAPPPPRPPPRRARAPPAPRARRRPPPRPPHARHLHPSPPAPFRGAGGRRGPRRSAGGKPREGPVGSAAGGSPRRAQRVRARLWRPPTQTYPQQLAFFFLGHDDSTQGSNFVHPSVS